jgi:glycosyltransferase involved in cell wall biosynthesis
MRILNATQTYAPFFEFGGPPVKVKALAEGMACRGHQVTVLTADWGLNARQSNVVSEPPAETSPFGRRQKVNGVSAIYLPNWLHYRATSWNPALGRYLRARLGEFDVVHIFGLYDLLGPRVANECRKRNIPYVVEPIGMFVPIVRNLRLKRWYHRIWGREMLEGASAIIVTAEQEREDLLAGGFARSKVVLRRNGVEAPKKIPERGTFRASLQLNPQDKLILFLGRLSEKKSPDLLLKAFAALLKGSGHLAFVGPDESGMKARLQEMAKQLSIQAYVHFSPALQGEDKWAAYKDSDIFVLPSQNENFGNTAAEAVAAGTPTIVTENCGIAPLLDGMAGLVVRHEEADLRDALERLLEDNALYQRLQNGCSEATTRLGWGQPLDEMEALYSVLATQSVS